MTRLTTEDVRDHFAYGCGPEHTWDESRSDFDRWMTTHDDELKVRLAALEVFTADGVEQWMAHPQPRLDGLTPIETIGNGQTDSVLALIDALADGVFF